MIQSLSYALRDQVAGIGRASTTPKLGTQSSLLVDWWSKMEQEQEMLVKLTLAAYDICAHSPAVVKWQSLPLVAHASRSTLKCFLPVNLTPACQILRHLHNSARLLTKGCLSACEQTVAFMVHMPCTGCPCYALRELEWGVPPQNERPRSF